MSLQALMDVLEEKWKFDPDNYPLLKVMDSGEKKVFALKHVQLHQGGTLGALARSLEPLDHGKPLDEDILRVIRAEVVVKMFINTLRLADLAGFSAEQLELASLRFLNQGAKK